jgi:hypothetical protein
MLAQTALDFAPNALQSRGDVVRCRGGWRRQRAGSGISRSSGPSQPLAVPELIEECFDRIFATTATIEDHFEQVLGVLDPKIL